MPQLRFHQDHIHRVDVNTTKTYRPGWTGELPVAVAHAARKAGRAEFIGETAEADEKAFQAELEKEKAVVIPEDYKSLSAADLVELAHALGAGEDVKFKADALAFVDKIAAERAEPPLV